MNTQAVIQVMLLVAVLALAGPVAARSLASNEVDSQGARLFSVTVRAGLSRKSGVNFFAQPGEAF